MISKIVLPMLLISCLAGCAAQDSYSKTLGLPDTTESQKSSRAGCLSSIGGVPQSGVRAEVIGFVVVVLQGHHGGCGQEVIGAHRGTEDLTG